MGISESNHCTFRASPIIAPRLVSRSLRYMPQGQFSTLLAQLVAMLRAIKERSSGRRGFEDGCGCNGAPERQCLVREVRIMICRPWLWVCFFQEKSERA